MHLDYEPEIIFPTQFYGYFDGNYYTYYLVGFTDDEFVQVFLTILYDRILEPSWSMLKKAREVKLKSTYKNLVLSNLEENKRRFMVFIENLEKHLDIRNAIVKGLKAQLRK